MSAILNTFLSESFDLGLRVSISRKWSRDLHTLDGKIIINSARVSDWLKKSKLALWFVEKRELRTIGMILIRRNFRCAFLIGWKLSAVNIYLSGINIEISASILWNDLIALAMDRVPDKSMPNVWVPLSVGRKMYIVDYAKSNLPIRRGLANSLLPQIM